MNNVRERRYKNDWNLCKLMAKKQLRRVNQNLWIRTNTLATLSKPVAAPAFFLGGGETRARHISGEGGKFPQIVLGFDHFWGHDPPKIIGCDHFVQYRKMSIFFLDFS